MAEFDVFALLTSGEALLVYGIILGIFAGGVIVYYIFKQRTEGTVFEFEKFEDVVWDDISNRFKLEGIKSKSKIIHGFNNPLGNVNKRLHVKGEWSVLEYDPSKRDYKKKTITKKERDDKGKIIKTTTTEVTEPYDLIIFEVSSGSFFDDSKYIIVNADHVEFETRSNTWTIKPEISLRIFGKCWVTSTEGQKMIQEISFRRSLENNHTFLMNQSRKVIHLETSFAQKNELLLGRGISKKLQYDQHAKDVLQRASDIDGGVEDET